MYTAVGNPQNVEFFWTPRVWQYWRPSDSTVVDADPLPPRADVSPPPRNARAGPPQDMWADFNFSSFTMDLVPVILPRVAKAYLQLFCSPELRQTTTSDKLRLFRLYLGRELPIITHERQLGLRGNFPLDICRYDALKKRLDDAPFLMPTID